MIGISAMSFIVMGTKFGDESLRSKCVFHCVDNGDLDHPRRAAGIRNRSQF